jgi:hypothetical protein
MLFKGLQILNSGMQILLSLQILYVIGGNFWGLWTLLGGLQILFGSADPFLGYTNAFCGLRALFRACGSIIGSVYPDLSRHFATDLEADIFCGRGRV